MQSMLAARPSRPSRLMVEQFGGSSSAFDRCAQACQRLLSRSLAVLEVANHRGEPCPPRVESPILRGSFDSENAAGNRPVCRRARRFARPTRIASSSTLPVGHRTTGSLQAMGFKSGRLDSSTLKELIENSTLSTHYGGEGGIRTLDGLSTHTHFPGVLLRPLGHLSAATR